MPGKKAAGALVLAAGALALGVGAAVAAEDNREYSTPATADGVEYRLAPTMPPEVAPEVAPVTMPPEHAQDGRDQ